MCNDINCEVNFVITQIKQFWGDSATNIQIQKVVDNPYSMFTLGITLYGDKQILVEYERSTLGFYVDINGKYVGLSKLTNEPIFKGFDSYHQENMIYNFTVLDKAIQSI